MNLHPQLLISYVLSTLVQAGLADRETIHDNLKVHQERTSQFIAICNRQTVLNVMKCLRMVLCLSGITLVGCDREVESPSPTTYEDQFSLITDLRACLREGISEI
ncbi:MAG: hypothetical protein H7222_01390 [Methylotenera sp.]|nr:hypothetical protein [Oligoflexia bacterium]